MRKRIITGMMMLALTLCLCGCGGAQANKAGDGQSDVTTIVVGTMGTYSPFSFYDENNNITGYDMEVLKKIEEIDPTIHFEIQAGAWESLFPGLDAGKYQMLANQIAWNEEREEKYFLTKNTYFVSTNQLIVRNDNDTITSLEDLARDGGIVGLTVGDNNNYGVEQWNKENEDKQVRVQYYNEDITTILQDIDNGRIAATANDPAVAVSKAETQGLAVKPVGEPLLQIPVHFIFAKDEAGEKLRERIDEDLAVLLENGELSRLSQEWFKADYTKMR